MSVAAIFGKPRSGKSTLLRRFVYESKAPVRAFLIIDRDGMGTWDGPVFTSIRAARAAELVPRFMVFRGVPGWEVAELAIDLGDCVVVDEEVHRTIAERPWKPWDRRHRDKGHPLYAILHEGAHLDNARGESCQVDALIATHRPANLPTDLPALCDSVYLGPLVAYTDAERVFREGWLPEATSARQAAEILRARRVGEFTRWPL